MKSIFTRVELWIVFAVALLLRLIFVWQWQSLPYSLTPFLDAQAYDTWAQEIAMGQIVRWTAFYQSPLYSYFLALIYKVFAHSFLFVSLLQALMGALTCVVVAEIAGQYFGKRAALEAGLLAAMERAFIFFTAPALKETLMLLMLALFVLIALRVLFERKGFIWAGLLLAACVLLRGNLLLLAPALLAMIVWRDRARGVKQAALFVVTFGIAMLPSVVHNSVAGGDFVLSTYNGGFNFYIGNSPHASGANSYPPSVSTDAIQEELDVRRIANEAAGEELSPGKVSSYWFGKGVEFIRENPGTFLKLLANKFRFFWNDQEIGDNYDLEFLSRESGKLLTWPLVSFGFVAIFAVFGFIALAGTSPVVRALGFFTLVYMASGMLFYVTDRYRLPVVIFILPVAGAATALLTDLVRMQRWKPLSRYALGLIPFAALIFIPLPNHMKISDAYNWGQQATLYSDANHDQAAIEAFEKGYAIDPVAMTTQPFVKASTSYERSGNLQKSEELLVKATELFPNDGFTFFNLGRFHYEHGRSDSAIELYNKALFIMPYHFQPYIGLGLLYYTRKEYALARESVRRGLLIKPDSPELLQLQNMLDAVSY